MNLIHQKQSLVVNPLSSMEEGECQKRLVHQICILWRSQKAIFCPALGFGEARAPVSAATYLLCWPRLQFSSSDSVLISNKHLLLCWQMNVMQSWGNDGFRRASLLLPSICTLYFMWGQQFCSTKTLQELVRSKSISIITCICSCITFFFLSVHSSLWDKRVCLSISGSKMATHCMYLMHSPLTLCAVMCSHKSL